MNPVTFTYTLATADTDGVAKSQSGTAGTALKMDGAFVNVGSVAVLDTTRRVSIVSVGDESSNTFTIDGYADITATSAPVREIITGGTAGGTVYTSLDFGQVTSIVPTSNTADKVEVGTNAIGSTLWKNPSTSMAPFDLNMDVDVTGTVNYTIQTTMDPFWKVLTPSYIPAVRNTAVAAATTDATLELTSPVTGWRVLINSGTGTIAVASIQSGIANY